MIGAQDEHGYRDAKAQQGGAPEELPGHRNRRGNAFDPLAEKTGKCGADNRQDRHGPDVDHAISHRIDTVRPVHTEARKHHLIYVVVDRGGRSGDGKNQAFS